MYAQDYSAYTKQELKTQLQEINSKLHELIVIYRKRNYLLLSEDDVQRLCNMIHEYLSKRREIERELGKRMAIEDNFTCRVSQSNQRRYDEQKEPDMAKFVLVISAIYLIFGVVMWLSIM